MRFHPYIKKNIIIAWPLALNALLMQSMLMIDTFQVSPLGETSLAAMGIAATIVAFMFGIQVSLANGSQLVLSRAVGSGVSRSITKGYWAGISISFVVALLFWLLITLFESPIIRFLTDDLAVYQGVHAYLSVAKYLVIMNAFTQVTISLFNALGRTKTPFKGYLLELPINTICSYFLIHGFFHFGGLGVQGSALGSLIAITVRFSYLLVCIRRCSQVNLSISNIGDSFKRNIQNHFKEIFPIAANMAMLQIGTTIYQLLYSQLNINAYVAITLVMPWIRAGSQFITAWAQSSAITISQAIGSREMDDLHENVDISIDVAVGISFISVLFFFCLSFVITKFYPHLDPITYDSLNAIAPLYIGLPLLRGYNTVHGNIMRAIGKTTEVFKINLAGRLVALPLCALIIVHFNGSIFWAFAVQPFEELIKALPFRYLARKSMREFDKSKAEKLMYD